MVNLVNNVDLDKVAETVASGKNNRDTLKKPIKLQGEWILDPSKGYQFRTELTYEKGKQVIEMDSPSFLGGNGNRLGPMAYCVAGITSCFIAIFASVAAEQGIKLKRLNVNTECKMNFAKTFNIADEPVTERIVFDVDAEADNCNKDRLQQILKQAEERCPAMYSMMHIIPVDAQIK